MPLPPDLHQRLDNTLADVAKMLWRLECIYTDFNEQRPDELAEIRKEYKALQTLRADLEKWQKETS